MNGKQPGNEGAASYVARQTAKEREDQQHVRAVQEQVGEVIAAGPSAIEGRVGHQRKPGQRDPVGVVETGPCPSNAGPVEAGQHLSIFAHIAGIVEHQKAKAGNLPIDRDRQREQQPTEKGLQLLVAQTAANDVAGSAWERDGRLPICGRGTPIFGIKIGEFLQPPENRATAIFYARMSRITLPETSVSR